MLRAAEPLLQVVKRALLFDEQYLLQVTSGRPEGERLRSAFQLSADLKALDGKAPFRNNFVDLVGQLRGFRARVMRW